MQRPPFKSLVACAAALLLATGVLAQDPYPNQPITIIVPYSPGGATDVIGRVLAAGMSRQLKQPVIVENKPGAGGTLSVTEMMRTRPDGYRLTLAPVSIFRQPYVQKTAYEPLRDLTYIASFIAFDFILAVSADSPFKTVKDVVDYARAHQGELNYGTPGKFSGNQVVMTLLGKVAGASFVHVPFKGDTEATAALLGGHVKTSVSINGILSYMESGKVRALAIAAEKRPQAFADTPTFQELGYDVVVVSPLGLAGPRDLPRPIVEKLDAAVKAALDEPEMQRVIRNYGIRTDYRDHRAYTEFARNYFANEKSIVQSLELSN